MAVGDLYLGATPVGGSSPFDDDSLPSFVAYNAASSTITAPMPGGGVVQDGDYCMLAYGQDTAGGNGGHLYTAAPDGWAHLGGQILRTMLDIFGKHILASQGSVTPPNGASGSQCIATSWIWRNVGTVVPLAHAYNSNGNVTLPSFELPFNNMRVVLLSSCSTAGGSMTSVPSGFTNHGSPSRWYPAIACASRQYTDKGSVAAGLAVGWTGYAKDYTSLVALGLTPPLAS